MCVRASDADPTGRVMHNYRLYGLNRTAGEAAIEALAFPDLRTQNSQAIKPMSETVRVGIIGDLNPDFRPHTATDEAIGHAAEALEMSADVEWLPTASLEQQTEKTLLAFDALWCAPGSPYESMDGALNAIRLARELQWPFVGTCGGFQHVVIEYARNVLGFEDAQHAEYDPYASDLFISELTCSLAGKTMTVHVEEPSGAFDLYHNNVKLIEGVDAMLLTSPSKIEDGLLHRAAQLSPKLFRTKLGVSPVVEGQQSPNDQGRHDLADDASWVPADEMVQLQPVFKPPEDNLNRPP